MGEFATASRNRMVLRDKLVRRAISLIDNPSQKRIRRIFPNSAMVITLRKLPREKWAGEVNCLVNFQ